MFELEKFDEKSARNLNPQVLAFVGDGVYSLYIRHRVLLDNQSKGRDLHNEVTNYVKAKGQSQFINKLLPLLSDDEMAVFKRGRNHKTLSQAKNASIVDYRKATGLEALIGYLYLTGKTDRLNEILNLSIGEKDED